MQVRDFRGYKEAADLSKISIENLAYPSKNVLINRGKVVTRGGLENDGTAYTIESAVHSEYVWKDCIGGVRQMRVFDQTVQVKHDDHWYTIFTALDSAVARVFFVSWTDGNGSIIKKRLVMSDGSTTLYMWSGFIGTVESYTPTTVTFVADKANLGLMGADSGSTTTQTVLLYDSGDYAATDTETYTTDPTGGLTMALVGAPSFTPVAGDIVIAKPIAYANAISSADPIDVIKLYNGHIVAANYDKVGLFFSHIQTFTLASGWNFTMPAAMSRTALTAIYVQIDGNFTAMEAREGILWVSDKDDWYRVAKTVEVNAYGLWTDVEKFEGGENKGALPMAVAKHKNDIIYMAQDYTLQRITTIDVIDKDDILLLSNDVESMLRRFDVDDVRLYYIERGIFIIFPQESKMVILDTSEETWFFQPPQDIPINCMSVVDGIKYGHHNSRNESYKLFSTRLDLGAAMAEAVIALGYQHDGHAFRFKKHGIVGMDCRLTDATTVQWDRYFEEDAARALGTATFNGADIVKFNSDVDGSWAANPYASLPIAGADDGTDVYRAFVYDRDRVDGYLEHRPIITISGEGNEMHLLGLFWEDEKSPRKISDDLFLPRT